MDSKRDSVDISEDNSVHSPTNSPSQATLCTDGEKKLDSTHVLHVDEVPRTRRACTGIGIGRSQTMGLVHAWMGEFIWILVSICSLIVIVAVLSAYNDQSLPRLPLRITLNTFVAFFSTLSKAAFMMPITEAISQWKWNWFTKDKPVTDFQTFDDASRGSWGSMYMLSRLRWRSAGSLGALVMIISVITSPITQQAILYPSPVSHWGYDWPNHNSRTIMSDMTVRILQGFLAPVDQIHEPAPINCPTGNCTFPRTSSLGMCVKLTNITSHLNVTESRAVDPKNWIIDINMPAATREYRATLGDACVLSGPPTLMAASCKMPSGQSFAFADDAGLMATQVYSQLFIYSRHDNTTFANLSNPGPVRYQAAEAFFHLCVQTLDMAVSDGLRVFTPVQVSHELLDPPPPPGHPTVDLSCAVLQPPKTRLLCNFTSEKPWEQPTSWLRLKDPATTGAGRGAGYFAAQNTTMAALASVLYTETLFAYLYQPTLNRDWSRGSGSNYIRMIEALYGRADVPLSKLPPLDLALQFSRMERLVGNVANSVTNMTRTSPSWTANGDGADAAQRNSYAVSGVALAPETYVKVRWGWLGFLVGEIALATIFLVITVVSTRRLRVEVLKSSTMATLVALDGDVRSAVGESASVGELEQRGRSVVARLSGHELVMAGQTTPRRRRLTLRSWSWKKRET